MLDKCLLFSGGKDSLACLYLLEQEWDDLYILWANTGKNFPELLETIEKVRDLVPHFVEINTYRESQNEQYGIPSSVVPINFTRQGKYLTGKEQNLPLIQSYLNCCYENIGFPLLRWCYENGVRTVYKGQRNQESYKSISRNGMVAEGITYLQPIEDWTKEQVLAYLTEKMGGALPFHLTAFEHSSMDCYDCTAYLEHSQDKIEFMKEKYPQYYSEFQGRMTILKEVLKEETKWII